VIHITKTLLESWRYCFSCAEGYEDEAYADFLKTLRREPSETTEAMLNGLAFEDRCYRAAEGKTIRSDAKWREGALKVAEVIKGAQIQVPISRPIEVDGTTYLLKGILDALRAGVIYDVKFLNKSLGSADVYGKWLNCTQHPAYFYLVPEAHEFQYVGSDGSDVYIETYQRDQTPYIGEIIHDFLEFLKGEGLMDVFAERWEV
jgi:hypothetical protein